MVHSSRVFPVVAFGLAGLALAAGAAVAQNTEVVPAPIVVPAPAPAPAPVVVPAPPAPGAAALPPGAALAAQHDAQNRLLAQRAARTDAIRKLAERIKGLHITSNTYVKDFVAENDQIAAALDTFIKGVKEAGPYRHFADGTCEVDMEVKLVTVIQELKSIHDRYYKGDKVKASDFDQMTVTNKESIIRETGSGAAREQFTPAGPVAPPAMAPGGIPPIWAQTCTAQGRLMAVRAARLDAIRKLTERIKGLRITSNTYVKDFVAENDEINTAIDQMLKTGGRERSVVYRPNELVVDCTMEMTLRTVYEELKSIHDRYYKGDKVKSSDFDQVIRTVKDEVISETGNGVPPAQYLKEAPMAPAPAAAPAPMPGGPAWPATLTATGQAAVDTNNENIAQAKLMAMRAAELDARRKLAEQINGLHISSNTTVKDFVAQSDDIRTDLDTYQQGVRIVRSEVKDDGTAEAVVEIPTDRLASIISFWRQKGIAVR